MYVTVLLDSSYEYEHKTAALECVYRLVIRRTCTVSTSAIQVLLT